MPWRRSPGSTTPALHVLFFRARNPGSLPIRGVTWSTWKHRRLVLSGDRIIDATAFHCVRERSPADLRATAGEIVRRRIAVVDMDAAPAFAREQVGEAHDRIGAVGRLLRQGWDSDAAWACSELPEVIVRAGGRVRWAHQPSRITPQLAWMAA